MNKDLRALFSFILLLLAIVALTSGVTVNGKHYGVRDCSYERGVELDNGVEPKPSAPL